MQLTTQLAQQQQQQQQGAQQQQHMGSQYSQGGPVSSSQGYTQPFPGSQPSSHPLSAANGFPATYTSQAGQLPYPQESAPGQFPMPQSFAQGQFPMSQTNSMPQVSSMPTCSQPVGFEHMTNGFASMPVSSQYSLPSMPQASMQPQFQGQMPGQGHMAPAQQQVIGMQPNLAGSLSSSGMSQRPMNSIPPTHTTGTGPLMTFPGQGIHGYQGQTSRSAYQPPTAVLTTDQLAMPAQQNATQSLPYSMQNGYYQPPVSMVTSCYAPAMTSSQGQSLPTVSPGHLPPSSLTSTGMSEQMRKVKEYQEYLLSRHEQSKRVLEDTKAEIKRRRENLLQRYPNLDLSRLEDLGAKGLTNGIQSSQQQTVAQQPQAGPTPAPRETIQGHVDPTVASLLASLAAHPYYASSLSQPPNNTGTQPSQPGGTSTSTVTVGAAQMNGYLPESLNSDTNLRKNKFESIRKSLPFEGDDSFQTPVRVYEAYAERNLDTTSCTDITESETSTLTEKGSPALKPAPRPAPRVLEKNEPLAASRDQARRNAELRRQEMDQTTTEESEGDTSASFLSEGPADVALSRQAELERQLADIQRQKEEIIRRHQVCVASIGKSMFHIRKHRNIFFQYNTH